MKYFRKCLADKKDTETIRRQHLISERRGRYWSCMSLAMKLSQLVIGNRRAITNTPHNGMTESDIFHLPVVWNKKAFSGWRAQ